MKVEIFISVVALPLLMGGVPHNREPGNSRHVDPEIAIAIATAEGVLAPELAFTLLGGYGADAQLSDGPDVASDEPFRNKQIWNVRYEDGTVVVNKAHRNHQLRDVLQHVLWGRGDCDWRDGANQRICYNTKEHSIDMVDAHGSIVAIYARSVD